MGYSFPIFPATSCTAVLLSQNSLSLPCSIKDTVTLVVRVNNIPSGLNYLNSIAILNVLNPNVARGTGQFGLRILKGLYNEYDYEYSFSQIGYTLPVAGATASLTLVTNVYPNNIGQYKITFKPTANMIIPAGGTIRIRVPITVPGLVIDQTKIKVTPSVDLINVVPVSPIPSVPLKFYKDFIILYNLVQTTVTAATGIDLTITGIQNMPFAGPTPSFDVDIRANGMENVLARATTSSCYCSDCNHSSNKRLHDIIRCGCYHEQAVHRGHSQLRNYIQDNEYSTKQRSDYYNLQCPCRFHNFGLLGND